MRFPHYLLTMVVVAVPVRNAQHGGWRTRPHSRKCNSSRRTANTNFTNRHNDCANRCFTNRR